MVWFGLNPHKALHYHLLFWLVALLPPLIGAGISMSVMHSLDFSWDYNGLTFWVDNNKLPIGIMALGIPFGVMVGSFHRTLQTAEQIRQTESTNNFKNYFEHKRVFTESLRKHLPFDFDINKELWYSVFFPESQKGDYSISKEITDLFILLDNKVDSVDFIDFSLRKTNSIDEDVDGYFNAMSCFLSYCYVVFEDALFKDCFCFSDGSKELSGAEINDNFLIERYNLLVDVFEVALKCDFSSSCRSEFRVIDYRFISYDNFERDCGRGLIDLIEEEYASKKVSLEDLIDLAEWNPRKDFEDFDDQCFDQKQSSIKHQLKFVFCLKEL